MLQICVDLTDQIFRHPAGYNMEMSEMKTGKDTSKGNMSILLLMDLGGPSWVVVALRSCVIRNLIFLSLPHHPVFTVALIPVIGPQHLVSGAAQCSFGKGTENPCVTSISNSFSSPPEIPLWTCGSLMLAILFDGFVDSLSPVGLATACDFSDAAFLVVSLRLWGSFPPFCCWSWPGVWVA